MLVLNELRVLGYGMELAKVARAAVLDGAIPRVVWVPTQTRLVGCRYRHLKQPELELIQIIPPNRNYTDMALLDVRAPLASQSCHLPGALSTAHDREMPTPALAGG